MKLRGSWNGPGVTSYDRRFSASLNALFMMEANAYACALYRFYAFHVADPGAPRRAKRSYREMQAVCLALGDEEVVAQIREAADAAVGIDGSAE